MAKSGTRNNRKVRMFINLIKRINQKLNFKFFLDLLNHQIEWTL